MADYTSTMDRSYWEIPDRPVEKLSTPIIPINELGATFPETNPATGANIIQNLQGLIRSGASSGQLVLTTSSQQPIGGRPKAYGTEVRQAMRELARANKFNITGVEMPTSSISNLSGFNPQNFSFSNQKLEADMEEVRSAMKFAADIAGGGSVDIWSQEAPRTIFDAEWNTKDEKGNPIKPVFDTEDWKKRQGIKVVVDTRTGDHVGAIPTEITHNMVVWKTGINKEGKRVFLDENDQPTTYENRIAEIKEGEMTTAPKTLSDYDKDKFNDFDEQTKKKLQGVDKEVLFWNDIAQAQINIMEGQSQQHKARAEQLEKEKSKLDKEKDKDTIRLYEQERKAMLLQAAGERQRVEELKEKLSNSASASKFGVERTKKSYAELGVYAWQETKFNKNVEPDKPLAVGPELGWPTYFGGHPDEFIEVVKGSRDEMVKLLTQKEIEKGKPNLYFQEGMSVSDAKKLSEKHIKGIFDTGHLGMWLDNFRRVPGESEEKRVEKFKEWYMNQVDKLAASGTVGGIQAVDSASGAHGHLPPGEGIFPVVDAVKRFKEKGFKGFIVSEGHEEEKFGTNRILTQAWKHFGSPISAPNGYLVGGGRSPGGPAYGIPWGRTTDNYMGRTYTPFFVVGAYSPSNEWKLWSEVPLE